MINKRQKIIEVLTIAMEKPEIANALIQRVINELNKPQPEPELMGNTVTFMTRAIFNIVAKHQEINGGYFIADGDIDDFVERLAKVINSTFEPLKPKNTNPPQREWVGLTEEEVTDFTLFHAVVDEECISAIEAKLKEKNT